MKKNIRSIIYVLFLIIILAVPYFVFAGALDNLKNVAEGGGYAKDVNETSAAGMLGTVVAAFFSILGMVFVILFLYAGYNWMIAAGDNSKVEKAKDTMQRAIIGLIITVGAYAIWAFISNYIFG